MKKSVCIASVIVVLVLIFEKLPAQLIIKGEFRPRFHYCKGYKNLWIDTLEPAFFISQRTRLSLFYEKEKFASKIVLQDVRVWGDESKAGSTGTFGDDASTDIHEAWFEWHFSEKLSLRLGRQVWSYDDERILAKRNWNQHGIAYDAALFSYKTSTYKVDAGFSYNNQTNATTAQFFTTDKMKSLNFIHYKNTEKENVETSAVLIQSAYQDEIDIKKLHWLHTFGYYRKYTYDKFKTYGNFYTQIGKNKYGYGVLAFMLALRTNYRIVKQLNVGAGFDYISGQNSTKSSFIFQGRNNAFNVLYGKRHGFYGYMDYFSAHVSNTLGKGLADVMVSAKWLPSETFNFAVDCHYFRLEQKILHSSAKEIKYIDKNLGYELDFTLKYAPQSDFQMQVGYSFLVPTKTLKVLQNVYPEATDFSQFFYLTFCYKPVFFSSEKE